MNIKKFFKGKGTGYYLMCGSFICGIVALVVYLLTGVDEFNSKLDSTVTVAYIIFLVLAAAMLVYEVRLIKFATYAVGLYAFLMYIVFKVNYITNLFVSIDPTAVTAGFILTIIFGILAWVLALVSAIMTKTGIKKGEEAV